jgi:hypothetical protein
VTVLPLELDEALELLDEVPAPLDDTPEPVDDAVEVLDEDDPLTALQRSG